MAKTIDYDTEAQKLEAAADEARAKAREIRAKQEADEAARKDAHDESRDRFEEDRRANFGRFTDEVKAKRAGFEAAVKDGGDIFAAWAAYMGAVQVATSEDARIANWQWQRAQELFDARMVTINDAVQQLQAIRQEYERLPATASQAFYGRRPAGWTDEKGLEVDPRVAKINAELNAIAEETGVEHRRESGDTAWVSSLTLGVEKPRMSMTTGSADRYESRTFVQAFSEAAEAAAKAVREEHAKAVRQAIDAL